MQSLQTGLSSLSDSLFNVVEGISFQNAILTSFSILSNDYEANKITTNSYLNIINNDIDNLVTNLSTLSNDVSINYVNNTAWSTLSTAIDDRFELTTIYIDDKITEQHEYTDQEVEALRVEGYIQEAVTQILAWATSDEGKRFRKKVWDGIETKWLSFTGRRAYTELIDDIANSSTDELDQVIQPGLPKRG